MNLTIPDKLHKFLVLIGSILIAFIYFQKENISKEYNDRIESNYRLIDSIELQIKRLEVQSNEMVKKSEILSQKYNVENPLTKDKKSNLLFSRILNGSKENMIVSDSIANDWKKYGRNESEVYLLIEKSKQIDKRLDEEKEIKDSKLYNLNFYENIGLFFLVLGLMIWILSELPTNKNEYEHYSKKIEDRTYRCCQSCGNKFTSLRKYGKEINGETNYAFCISCYDDGKFTNEDLTVKDVLDETREKIKNKDWIDKLIILSKIKKLERWE